MKLTTDNDPRSHFERFNSHLPSENISINHTSFRVAGRGDTFVAYKLGRYSERYLGAFKTRQQAIERCEFNT